MEGRVEGREEDKGAVAKSCLGGRGTLEESLLSQQQQSRWKGAWSKQCSPSQGFSAR